MSRHAFVAVRCPKAAAFVTQAALRCQVSCLHAKEPAIRIDAFADHREQKRLPAGQRAEGLFDCLDCAVERYQALDFGARENQERLWLRHRSGSNSTSSLAGGWRTIF